MTRTIKLQSITGIHNMNLYGIIMILMIVFTGIFSLSLADMMDKIVVRNNGKITLEITAKSGYWRDIQDAVNLAASLGVGTVRIPEGVWNFVNIGESWIDARVIIPAGISLFGASTERYENGSVKEWKTVLVLPWDMPGASASMPIWFKIVGNSDPNKPSRFSDIKLVGYRKFDPNSTNMYVGVRIEHVINFRVDHCYFDNIAGQAVRVIESSGVIDHCYLVNDYGVPVPYSDRTVDYGVYVTRDDAHATTDYWEPDLSKILGKYLEYTVFIEDCYFSKWRHCTVGNKGAHIVVRHCIFNRDLAYGTIDMHEIYQETFISGRAYEVYENQFINPEPVAGVVDAIRIRSGGGVFFNNTAYGYNYFMYTYNSGWNPTFYPDDIYLWNNTGDYGRLIWGDIVTDEDLDDYFLSKPDWYTPYPYPHPLTYS